MQSSNATASSDPAGDSDVTSGMLTRNPDLNAALLRLKQAPYRLLLGAALMLASGLLGTVVFQAESATVQALRAKTDLAAGVELRADDFEVVWLPQRLTGQWLTLGDLPGATLNSSLRAGDLLYQGDTSDWQDQRPTVSLALDAASLPHGILVGSNVQLWSSSPDGATLLAANASVQALSQDGSSGQWAVTLAVEPPLLEAVLTAMARDGLRVVGNS